MHDLPRVIVSLSRVLDKMHKRVHVLTSGSYRVQRRTLVIAFQIDEQGCEQFLGQEAHTSDRSEIDAWYRNIVHISHIFI